MAKWALLEVPDLSSEYVGEILEDTAKVAKTNFEAESKRIEGVAAKANDVAIQAIAKAAGGG